ncbi:hypothetical protein I3843_10G086300 [Carya illinoinensis]|uniref:Uncharacterized protein n=1 Tax=Carya illinoinensis TaxID=32201 RepID=A0A8T1P9H5_CARIL|nr:hypothetical protein I3760_10G088300 [Carya illinoinensis]KAG6620635.1 hypothetical protein I3842_Q058000 [Carya illinoinensis]KAG6639295.1 hypothetical protein CIPAW_10G089300 [Carya illinoinensis]KAG6691982.1 hypothetical protein I3842_10G088600 [Carya illinoinensis]KAG7959792.1 hypothetical protein I3843_10G086300 [Carya illinoinensis]
MVNSRIARFVSEVAPPQFISVIRHRETKMLDTINEEERDANPNNSRAACSRTSSSSSSIPTIASTANCKAFLKEVHRSFSLFDH